MSIQRKISETTIIEYEPFSDPKGKKKIKYPLENLYAVYIGDKNEIIEVTICKKETDSEGNTIYHDLLTNATYQTIDTPLEITVIKTFTLTSLLSEKSRKLIQKNGYITNFDLIDIYNELNEDTEYETHNWRKDGIEYQAPIFAKCYEWIVPILDDDEHELTKLIAAIKTTKKPAIIYGNEGIGKTTLIHKLLYYAKNDNSYIDINKIFMLDYNDMLQKTRTIKHIKNRIKKSLEFIKNINYNILVIDNVDVTNDVFLTTLTSLANEENINLVLVAKNKENVDVSNQTYQYIEVKEPKDEIKRNIFKVYLEEIIKQYKIKIDYFIDDIIDILIETDKNNFINTTNFTKNPKLGLQIFYNANIIASSKNIKNKKNKLVTKEDFVEALDQPNINMDSKTKEEIKERFQHLKSIKEQKSFEKHLKKHNYYC